jgi:hypothetical protein
MVVSQADRLDLPDASIRADLAVLPIIRTQPALKKR